MCVSVMSGSTKVFSLNTLAIRYVNVTVARDSKLISCAIHGWLETNENSEMSINLQNDLYGSAS